MLARFCHYRARSLLEPVLIYRGDHRCIEKATVYKTAVRDTVLLWFCKDLGTRLPPRCFVSTNGWLLAAVATIQRDLCMVSKQSADDGAPTRPAPTSSNTARTAHMIPASSLRIPRTCKYQKTCWARRLVPSTYINTLYPRVSTPVRRALATGATQMHASQLSYIRNQFRCGMGPLSRHRQPILHPPNRARGVGFQDFLRTNAHPRDSK